MRMFLFIIFCIAFSLLNAQSIAVYKKIKNHFIDSIELASSLHEASIHQFAASGDLDDGIKSSESFVPSVLNANRDLFTNTAAFHFGIRRFRAKGFDAKLFKVSINDIPMNQLSDGYAPWSSWGGLNEVMNNATAVIGLKENDLGFGSVGSATYIDVKASHLRAQTSVATTFSNRSYQYKISFTKITPFNKKGWAYAFCLSERYGSNGFVSGSYFNAPAYFFAVDKKLKEHLFSLSLMGAFSTSSRTAAITSNLHNLAGSNGYNPNWGMQNNSIRNANMQSLHYPLLILSHEFTTPDEIKITTSLACSMGEKKVTALDWYKAPDPRPDYYRYMPSFQSDSALQFLVNQLYNEQPELLQINWNRLYKVNQNSYETIQDVDGVSGRSVSGVRSRYILEDRAEQHKKIMFSSRVNQLIGTNFSFTANINFGWQSIRYFKSVNDLLGGDFYVDWNQFAEDKSVESAALQNDLNRPNRLLAVGDAFGYDYTMILQKLSGSAQLSYKTNRFDFFGGIEIDHLNNLRVGNVRNGVFSLNSYGPSTSDKFNNMALKAGTTYKFNGRNYFYLNTGWMLQAPLMNDYYISPRTRDTRHPKQSMENIASLETGYILNAPLIRFRINAYTALFKNGMNVMSFYHDGYKSMVNYAIGNINQLHLGAEISAEVQLTNRLRSNLAIALGKYVYTDRQTYAVSIDNEDYISEQGVVYTKNFPVTGTPQKAYSAGFTYQSPSGFLCSFSGNYLADYWLSFNPIRRTYDAMATVPANKDITTITSPEKLPDALVLDMTAAYSFSLGKSKSGTYRSLQLFLSAGNLLNQSIITGGYEQLRYDIANANTEKFPSKYYYSQGANYSLIIRFRW